MKSMSEAHDDDYADKARMRELRVAIEAFLDDPPSRVYPRTLDGLRTTAGLLKKQEAHIVAVWD